MITQLRQKCRKANKRDKREKVRKKGNKKNTSSISKSFLFKTISKSFLLKMISKSFCRKNDFEIVFSAERYRNRFFCRTISISFLLKTISKSFLTKTISKSFLQTGIKIAFEKNIPDQNRRKVWKSGGDEWGERDKWGRFFSVCMWRPTWIPRRRGRPREYTRLDVTNPGYLGLI